MVETEKRTKRKAKDRDGLYKRRGYWHYELLIDGKKRSFTTATKDYNEAKKKRAEAIAQREQGMLPLDSGRKRFELAAAEYIAHREATVSSGSVRIDKERLPPLQRFIGNRMLSEISARLIRGYQASRAKEVSPRTVNLEVKLLRGILKAEGQWKRLAEDVKPLKESNGTVGRALSADEALRLFTTAEQNHDWIVAYSAATIANDTGMRGVELRNVRLMDIDVDARKLVIRRSKNDSGLRTIHLTNDALRATLRLIDRAIAVGASTPDHYLMPAKIKRGYDPTKPTKGWRTAWRALTRRAGLRGFRFHDLRHTFITAHAEIGTPLPVVMAQAGHLSRRMTELYTHISQNALAQAALRFEESKAARLAEARQNLAIEQASCMGTYGTN